jgi:hypothetical protein
MEFYSINEYFHKFNSRLLLILLVPVAVFIAIYLQPADQSDDLPLHPDLLIYVCSSVLTLWVVVFVFFNKKIKTVRKGQGLRQKLEKYFLITIVRYSFFCLCSLGLAAVFYLTRSDVYTILFLGQIVIAGLRWPFSWKVSADLRLRGDEREMVYYKKDEL